MADASCAGGHQPAVGLRPHLASRPPWVGLLPLGNLGGSLRQGAGAGPAACTCVAFAFMASWAGFLAHPGAVPSFLEACGSLPALPSGALAAAAAYYVPLINYNPDLKLIINNLFAARTSSICR